MLFFGFWQALLLLFDGSVEWVLSEANLESSFASLLHT
jgi:hypothetical protein